MTTDPQDRGLPIPEHDESIHLLAVGRTDFEIDRVVEALSERGRRPTVTTAETLSGTAEAMGAEIDCVVCQPPVVDAGPQAVFERVREFAPVVPTVLVADQIPVSWAGVTRESVSAVLPADAARLASRLATVIDGLVTQSRMSPTEDTLCIETLRQLPQTTLVTDRAGSVLWMDPAAEALFGRSLEPSGEALSIDSLLGVESIDRSRLAEESPQSVETELETAAGTDGTFLVTATADVPRDDVILYTVREITGERRQQAELAEQRQTVDTLGSNTPVVVCTIDEEGIFTRSRGSALSQLDLEPGAVVGESALELYSDHPKIPDQLERALDGESVHGVVELQGRIFESWYEPLRDDSGAVTGIIGLSIDITEQEQRKQELEAYETALNTAADMIYQLDTEGRFVMANDAFTAETGYERSELLGDSAAKIMTEESYERGQELINQLVREGSREVLTPEFELEAADGSRFPVESRITLLYDDDDQFRGTIGVARNIAKRKQYEEMLSDLHDISLGLLTRRDPDAVVDQMLVALDTVLDIDLGGYFSFDEDRNVLEPDGTTSGVEAFAESPSTIEPGSSLAWDVFVEGSGRVYDDLSQADNLHSPEPPVESAVFVPLGEHGLLVCGSTERAAFDDQTVELVDLLAATAETVLDRIERDRRLEQSDQKLQQRLTALDRQQTVETRLRQITTGIVGAQRREEIYELVCRELAALEDCVLVWIAEPNTNQSTLVCQAQGGDDATYLDAISLTLDGQQRAESQLPAVRALEQGTLVSVERIADSLRAGDWQPEALSRDFQSVVSVPIASDGFTHGALSVYAGSTAAFDEQLQTALSELGETIAHALTSVEQQQSLAGNAAVEVEFRLEGTDTPALALAEQLDAPVLIEDAIPGQQTLLYGAVHGVERDAFRSACEAVTAIDSGTVLTQSDTQLAVRLTLSGHTVPETVADCGGSFHDFAIADGTGRLRVTFADEVRIGDAIQRIVSALPTAELHSRTQRTDPDVRESFETLTDRQREALLTAYHGGHYEWPREQPADELAAVLDVSKPTFLEHLRRAERKLLATRLPERFDT